MKNRPDKREIGVGWKAGLKLALRLALPLLAAAAQAVGQDNSGSRILVSSPALASPEQIVREINDPNTGSRWLLMRDPSHPGGPGRLVQAESAGGRAARNPARPELAGMDLRPAIHPGERLIVEENTSVVEARLEAVALGPAAIGAPFDARLAIGGRVVRVVALGAGRARIQTKAGVRP